MYILSGWYKSSGNIEISLCYITIDKTGVQFDSTVKDLPYTNKWKQFKVPVNIYYHGNIINGGTVEFLSKEIKWQDTSCLE